MRKTGDTAWYLSKIPGSGLTRQDHVTIAETKGDKTKIIHPNGRSAWVKTKNLRPTN